MIEPMEDETRYIGVDSELKIPCRECEGRGKWREQGYFFRCPECEGVGSFPTEFGEKILELIRQNLNNMLRFDADE